MRHVVEGFEHRTGIHCGSSAMADALRTIGLDLSEEMTLGLGSGPSFLVFEGLATTPSHFFLGRTETYEHDLCTALGVTFDERPVATFAEAWADIRARLVSNRVVLAITDLLYLPHYRTRSHFNGHRIVIAGFDDERGLALLADSHFPGLQETPLAALEQAMTSDHPPLATTACVYGSIDKTSAFESVEVLVDRALARSASHLRSHGLPALDRFAAHLPAWGASPDLPFCLRFCAQVIEKRGCGGGLFRRMYARFLAEANRPALAALALEAAEAWTALAGVLHVQSERVSPDFASISARVDDVAARERALWTAVGAPSATE